MQIKIDFKSKYSVKGLALSCDQKMMIFNLSKHIYYMDMNQIISKGREGKDKIKATSYLPQKVDQNQHNAIECNPQSSNVMATLSN